MRTPLLIAAIVLLSSVVAVEAQPKKGSSIDLKGKTVQQVFEELLPGMSAKEAKDRHGPEQQWQTICFQAGAPGNEKTRLDVCQLMSAKLDPKTPNPARVWLLKQLELLGRDESVEAVGTVLGDKDVHVRDAAVRCLTNNPTPAATTRLVAQLSQADGKARVSLIHALGHRGDAAAVEALGKLLGGKESTEATAAARALGRLGTVEASRLLAAARPTAQGQVRFWISDSYLLCADRRLKEGKTTDAAAIYKELHKSDEPRSVRLAALHGVLKTAGDDAGTMILQMLDGKDADARAVAIGQIDGVSAGAMKTLAAGIDKLPASARVLVLGGLAARGDRSQLPVAQAAAKHDDEAIRQAGLRALGRLGDASVVALLVETMQSNNKLSMTARDSLAQLAAEGVNEKLIIALRMEPHAGKRAALVGLLEARRATAAVPVLLLDAQSDDAGLRTAAMTALRQLAEPKHVTDMIPALLKAEKGREREEAERTITLICAQIVDPAKRAEPVLTALKDPPRADRILLLPLLGRLGGPQALELVRTALASEKAEQYEAGMISICNWPDATVSDDLIKLTQSGKEPAHRLLAMRALIRVNSGLQNERPNGERLATLKKAMELSARDEERQQVLGAISTVRDIESLRYVLPYLDHKTLQQHACRAVVELAHSRNLREPNKAEFDKALDRVISICKDKTLIERARQYKQAI